MVRYITKEVAEHHRWMREQRILDKREMRRNRFKLFNFYLIYVPGYGSLSHKVMMYDTEKVYESIS